MHPDVVMWLSDLPAFSAFCLIVRRVVLISSSPLAEQILSFSCSILPPILPNFSIFSRFLVFFFFCLPMPAAAHVAEAASIYSLFFVLQTLSRSFALEV